MKDGGESTPKLDYSSSMDERRQPAKSFRLDLDPQSLRLDLSYRRNRERLVYYAIAVGVTLAAFAVLMAALKLFV
jgi:hypothetical protein